MRGPLLACLVFAALCSCRDLISPDLPGEEDLELRWELTGNTVSPDRSEAAFMLANQSEDTLESEGWALFFNLMNPGVNQASVTGNVRFDHVNGDLMRITPREGFRLKPGETVEISYRQRGWLTKLGHAPQGPFMVYYDEEGRETGIVPVKNFMILPFPALEKIFPTESGIPLPDAGWVYELNRNRVALQADSMGKIIPSPDQMDLKGNRVLMGEDLVIHFDDGLEQEASYLSGMLSSVMAREPRARNRPGGGPDVILLALAEAGEGLAGEEYILKADSLTGIEILGGSPAGVFYGIQSLMALIPVKRWAEPQPEIELEAVDIRDAPAFVYRGMHLDLARNFNGPEAIRKLIRIMAFYKLNKLHLHLTDDEGWRLEIPSLPELAEVGGCRGHTSTNRDHLMPHYGSGGMASQESGYGSGYLTREEFIGILEFAARHHIEVIPEINFPGHARAAIYAMEARYDRFMEAGKPEEAEEFRLVDPEDESVYNSAQNFNDNVICVCRESSYSFFERVVDELISMYKEAGISLKTVHTGGDEVPEGVWAGSPMCREFLESHPEWKSARDLQVYFEGRLFNILKEKGLVMAGWEEIALKKGSNGNWLPNKAYLDEGVLPFVWNNQDSNTDLCNRLANTGFNVVLCNVTNLYFDQAYNHHPLEPGLYWGGYVNTRRAFEFVPSEPLKSLLSDKYWRPLDQATILEGKERMKKASRARILGLQGELWSETVKGGDMLEYYYLPRLLALSERSWTGDPSWSAVKVPEERSMAREQEWNEFANRIGNREMPRLDYIFGGFNYRLPPPGLRMAGDTLYANVDFPGIQIRYSTDGSDPDAESPLYTGPIKVNGEVRARSFDTRGRGSRVSLVH